MESISVDQAVFASSDRGAIRGYQLISKSSGIDRICERELCRWAPTQLPCDAPQWWSLNYVAITDTTVAVSRSLWGGPEYSGRGGTQVVTLILVIRDDQYASYAYHPLAVTRTAMAMGSLRLPLDMTCKQIPPVTLPRYPLIDPALLSTDDGLKPLLDEVTDLVLESRRVAIIGLTNPLAVVERVLSRLPRQARRDFSFTTGLSPATSRPFRAHFLSSIDAAKQRVLKSQGIVCIHVK